MAVLDVNQSECISFYGQGSPQCYTTGTTLRYVMHFFNGSTSPSSNERFFASLPSSLMCYDGDKGCHTVFTFDVSDFNVSMGTNYDWFACGNPNVNIRFPNTPSTNNCTTVAALYYHGGSGVNWKEIMPNYGVIAGGGLYRYNGTHWIYKSAAQSVCAPNPTVTLKGGYPFYYLNRGAECGGCSPVDSIACDVMGNEQKDGNSFICGSNLTWTSYLKCEDGGWYVCDLYSEHSCAGSVISEVRIADLRRAQNRVSIIDSFGRELQWDTGGFYTLFSNQKVTKTAFKFLEAETLQDWGRGEDDQVSVNYVWDPAKVSCSYNKVADVSYSVGESVNYDISSLNCTLIAGVVSSNVNLSISANLSSTAARLLDNGVITKNFTVKVIADAVLLDNFQVVYVGPSTLALSGHFIRLSDLTDISQSAFPNLTVSMGFYKQNATGTLASVLNVTTSNYTDSDYLYEKIAVSGGITAGDIVVYNASINASGYVAMPYSNQKTEVSALRVLFFKCKNNPKNTTFYDGVDYSSFGGVTSMQTGDVAVECVYQLANVSALTPSNLSVDSKVSLYNDIKTDTQMILVLGFNYSLPGPYAYVDPKDVSAGKPINIPFSHLVSYLVYNTNESVAYKKTDLLGVRVTLPPSRYVGPWAVLSNPAFSLTSYMDLIVESKLNTDDGFKFSGLSFLKPSYKENDTVVCQADWYDPFDTVESWTVTFSGDSSHSYTFDKKSVTSNFLTCLQSAGECVYSYSNSTGVTGDALKHKTIYWEIFNIQSCKSYLGGNTSSTCLDYKWKFFDGGKTGTLKCEVTLYRKTGAASVSKSVTTTVLLSGSDLQDQIASFLWNNIFWILLGLLVLFIVLMIIRTLKK